MISIFGSMTERLIGELAKTAAREAFDVARADRAQPSPISKEAVANRVAEKIKDSPLIQHATNNEPWYQSRVTLGALAAIVGGVSQLLGLAATGDLTFSALWSVLLPLGGGLFTLFGRWAAIKPLGT